MLGGKRFREYAPAFFWFAISAVIVSTGVLISGVLASPASTLELQRPAANVEVPDDNELEALYGIDRCGTEQEEPAPTKMTEEQEDRGRLIGRIARGVRKIGLAKGGGRWWECGKAYDDRNENEAAFEWAYRIVTLASDYS
ncbi:MAG: hypothetical protein ABFD77_04275, partial [Thermotogota bacterium]